MSSLDTGTSQATPNTAVDARTASDSGGEEGTSADTGVHRINYYQSLQKRLTTYRKLARDGPHLVAKYSLPKPAQPRKCRLDSEAISLYPPDAPADLIPIRIVGDGNCLPRCASVFVFGTERNHVEIRVRMAVELAAHPTEYSHVAKKYNIYSEDFHINSSANENYR